MTVAYQMLGFNSVLLLKLQNSINKRTQAKSAERNAILLSSKTRKKVQNQTQKMRHNNLKTNKNQMLGRSAGA